MKGKGSALLLILSISLVAALFFTDGPKKGNIRDLSAVRSGKPTYGFLVGQSPLPLLNLSEKEMTYDSHVGMSSNYFDPDRDSFYSFQGDYEEVVRAVRLELGSTFEIISHRYMAWSWNGEEPTGSLVVIVKDLRITQVTEVERAEFQRMEDLFFEFEDWDMGHHDSGWTTVWTRGASDVVNQGFSLGSDGSVVRDAVVAHRGPGVCAVTSVGSDATEACSELKRSTKEERP